MVSYNVYKATSSGAYVEGVCLASDEKPVVGIANGSILFAVDASNGETTRYMYDKSAMAWIEAECPCAGGGSGSGSGGGSAEPFVVNCTAEADHPAIFHADKTCEEIYNAYAAGRAVLFSGHRVETFGEAQVTITNLGSLVFANKNSGPDQSGAELTTYTLNFYFFESDAYRYRDGLPDTYPVIDLTA